MKGITRERPILERIAPPWLIKNLVHRKAAFIYVSKEPVFVKAKELNTTPYAIPGAAYSHEGDWCTFDDIVKKHNLTDPAIQRMAVIIDDAGTNRFQRARPAAGV